MLINELRDDVREESSKFGEVKNVKLYDVGVNFCVWRLIRPFLITIYHFYGVKGSKRIFNAVIVFLEPPRRSDFRLVQRAGDGGCLHRSHEQPLVR